MIKKLLLFNIYILSFGMFSYAQTDTTETEEEDFSLYENMSSIDSQKPIKSYASQKIQSQIPTRFVSIGYELQGNYMLTTPAFDNVEEQLHEIRFSHGIRAEGNFPVVSRNNILFAIGLAYNEQRYQFREPINEKTNPFVRSLAEAPLRSFGVNAQLFKPFNQKHLMIVQVQADYVGNWTITKWHNPKHIKVSGAILYGQKKNDRLMWGVGVARTYRLGEQNYIPVALFNYTARSQKWGFETLLPARADFKVMPDTRTFVRLGVDLEGNSYTINNQRGFFSSNLKNIELKRGEMRFRMIYERQIKGFYWVSMEGGYRLNWVYNLDEGDFYRGLFGNQPYLMENSLGNTFFVKLSVSLVSP